MCFRVVNPWVKLGFVALAIGLGMIPLAAQSTGRRAQSTVLRRPADSGFLGVGVIELTADRVKALGLKDNRGVEVTSVGHPSAAARAGLQEHDVILEANGKVIEDVDDFISLIGGSNPGTKISLIVWREGSTRKLTATLDAQRDNPFFDFPTPAVPALPDPSVLPGNPFPGMGGSPALIGFEGETLSPQLAAYFGVRVGVLVRTVNPGSPADKAGLKAGDVVVKVNGTPVTSPREISGLARTSPRKHLTFTVVRNKKEVTLNVEIAEYRSPFAFFDPF